MGPQGVGQAVGQDARVPGQHILALLPCQPHLRKVCSASWQTTPATSHSRQGLSQHNRWRYSFSSVQQACARATARLACR